MSVVPKSSSFSMVCPEHVTEVGPAAAILYARILWRSQDGPWRATKAELAAETGLTLPMIRTATQVLRERQWVAAVRSSADDATLTWSTVCAGQPESAESSPPPAESAGPPCGSLTTPTAESALSSYETGRDLETTPSTPPDVEEQQVLPLLSVVGSQADPGFDAEFDGFWSAYPRRVGKQAARKAYRAARKGASLDEIAAGLRAQLPDLRGRDLHLVPHPSTWLNQHRWEDDPRASAQPRTGPRNFDLERMQARAAGDAPAVTTGAAALALQMLEGPQ